MTKQATPDPIPAPGPSTGTQHVVDVRVSGQPAPEPKPAPAPAPAPDDGRMTVDNDGNEVWVGPRTPGGEKGEWILKSRYDHQRKSDLQRIATAEESLTKANTALEAVPGLQRTVDARGQDLVMVSSQIPQLADAEVRGFVRERYSRYQAEQGKEAKPFTEWFEVQKKTPSLLLAPYMVPPTPEKTKEQNLVAAIGEALKIKDVSIDAIQKLVNPPVTDDGPQTPQEALAVILREMVDGAAKTAVVRKPAGDPNKGTGETPDGSEPLSDEALVAALKARTISSDDPRVRAALLRQHGATALNPLKVQTT